MNCPDDVIEWFEETLSPITYKEFSRLQSPTTTLKKMSGSCHDQAIYELDALFNMGYSPKGHFLIAVDEDKQGYTTHSFVYFKHEDTWFWIENSWEDYVGIQEFASEENLIDLVTSLFVADYAYGLTVEHGAVDLEKHRAGEDLQTFVDVCLED